MLARPARAQVEKIGCGGEGVGPKSRRRGRVEKEATQALGESSDDALGTPVLLRGVGASEVEDSAVGG